MEHSSNKGIILILSILFIVVMMIPITGLIVAPSEIDWLEQPRYELGGLTLNEIFVDNNMKAYYETSLNTINGISDEVYELNGAYYYVQRINIDTTVVKASTGWVIRQILTTTQGFSLDLSSLGYIIPLNNATFYNAYTLTIGSDTYTLNSANNIYLNDDVKTFGIFTTGYDNALYIRVNKTTYPTTTDFEAYLQANDVTFLYELETSIETLLFDSGNTITPSEMLEAYYLYLSYL